MKNIFLMSLFWLSIIGIAYSYFVYPAILIFVSKIVNVRKLKSGNQYLPITILVTVHNEETEIEKKIRNLLELTYPRELMEVIIASDASSDGTDDIVRMYQNQGVKLVRSAVRKGKEAAQKKAIESILPGRIIIFSDVATGFSSESIQRIANIFAANPQVGAISSEDQFVIEDGKTSGESAYVKYEMWLRRLESKLAGLVGLSGSFFAARECVCKPWDDQIPSDFNVALSTNRMGMIAVSDPAVIGVYSDLKNPQAEYSRKVRTINRGMSAILANKKLIWRQIGSLFGFQLVSHKIMRWSVPFWYIAAVWTSSILSSKSMIYMFMFSLLVCALLIALITALVPWLRRYRLIRYLSYFFTVNCAILHAFLLILAGKRVKMWSPSKR